LKISARGFLFIKVNWIVIGVSNIQKLELVDGSIKKSVFD